MDIKAIKNGLSDHDPTKVEIYINYLVELSTVKDRDKKLKNPWFKYRTDQELINNFKKVATDGLSIDGEHITLQSTGISYDYIAFKNKMMLTYPESIIDVGLVYKDDTFKFEKQSGKVVYTHQINNPFNQDENNIIGGYCVIKNKRGEFITILSKDNIEKHRKVARTDSIWKAWYHEKCLVVIIKKACKQHFQDIYQNIETIDNENYDLSKSLEVDIDDKSSIESITTIEELRQYWKDHQGRNAGVLKEFNELLAKRKDEIESEDSKQEKETSNGDKTDETD